MYCRGECRILHACCTAVACIAAAAPPAHPLFDNGRWKKTRTNSWGKSLSSDPFVHRAAARPAIAPAGRLGRLQQGGAKGMRIVDLLLGSVLVARTAAQSCPLRAAICQCGCTWETEIQTLRPCRTSIAQPSYPPALNGPYFTFVHVLYLLPAHRPSKTCSTAMAMATTTWCARTTGRLVARRPSVRASIELGTV